MKNHEGLLARLQPVLHAMHRFRAPLLTLSVIVVFITSYLLILPALTLEKDTAKEQGGIAVTSDAASETLSFSGKGFDAEVGYTDAASVPERTELQVKEISQKTDQYQNYYTKAMKAVQDDAGDKTVSGLSFAKFYDVTLMAEGAEVQPDAPVDVTISYDKGIAAKDADHVRIIHFTEDAQGEVSPELLDSKKTDVTIETEKMTEASFEAESFSVYGVVYTVDFEYDVDGQKYTYSMDGGTSISLKALLHQLNVISDDKETSENEEQLFTDEVSDVAFSSPELVSVNKGDDGDWTLTSLKPFDTTETLTVTMKNGNVFTVKVTDAQEIGDTSSIDVNKSYIISTHDANGFHVLKADGSVETFADTSGFDALDNNYRWSFYYVFEEKDRESTLTYVYYFIRPANDKSKTIALNDPADTELIQEGTNNVAVLPQNGGGFFFKGYHDTELAYADGEFSGSTTPSLIRVFEQEPLPQYSFTVKTDDNTMGKVSGYNENDQWSGEVDQYITRTNNDKKNEYTIRAIPVNHQNKGVNKWIFDHWELNGEALDKNTYGATINRYQLEIPYNGSELKAFFKINPAYEMPDNEKEGRTLDKTELDQWLNDLKTKELPLNRDGCKKTAEVYDYENRIYRVDLTSQASLETFAGTIDLGFIIDVSASMNFPSSLSESDDVQDYAAKQISAINTISGPWYDRKTNGERWGLVPGKDYYIIADPSNTATACKLYWSNDESKWVLCDSSQKHARRFDPETGIEIVDKKTKKNYYDPDNSNYVIYEADDLVTQADLNDPKKRAILDKLGIAQAGTPKTRSFYLENSLNGTGETLKEILQLLSLAQDSNKDPDVKIAWNTFKNYLPNDNGQRQDQFQTAKNGINLNYDYNTYGGGTSTDVALLDAVGIKRSDIKQYNDMYDANKYGSRNNPVTIDGVQYKDEAKYSKWECENYNDQLSYQKINGKGFNWANSATKYAVLITDGAPQRGGKSINSQYVQDAAQKLKEQGITLITIGLSMENVEQGKILLYDIADDGKDGTPLFYNAKSGDELQYALYEVIRAILSDATVQGDVVDQVNEAFYPVDKASGRPLQDGEYIDLNGNLVPSNYSGAKGKVMRGGNASSGYTYTIKWENQDFPLDGWHGTVYVKAKEDLLGGNAVKTNQDAPGDPGAKITAKSYKVNPTDSEVVFINDQQKLTSKEVSLTTPRVNVNELSFLHDETEWTVYLGTEVDPKDQIKRLYDDILVEEVIKKGRGDDLDGDGLPDTGKAVAGDNLYYPLEPDSITDDREKDAEAASTRESFYMKDLILKLIKKLINSGDTSRDDWSQFVTKDEQQKDILNWDYFLQEAMGEGGIVIPYHEYGLTDGSNITISLEKTIVPGEEADLINKSPHAATVVGDEVEKYTLTIKYSPDYDVLPKGQGGRSSENFKTGTFGTMYQGHAAGTETSKNIHIINVFSKGLSITKTDPGFMNQLPGAKFDLYRTARADDPEDQKVSIEGLDGKYVLVSVLDMTDQATAVINPVEQLKENEQYLLVENKAPAGYNLLTEPIEVKLELTDDYTQAMEEDEEDHSTDVPAEGLYNWEQKAVIKLIGSNVQRTDESLTAELEHAALTPDTSTDITYYKISNTPGVELPYTGGTGTKAIRIIGCAMMLGAGVLLMLRRRRTYV